MAAHIPQQPCNRSTPSVGGRRRKSGDAHAEIVISPDGMLAMATLRPAARKGRPLTAAYLEGVLGGSGITHGIDRPALALAIDECNGGRVIENRVIARGQAPVADEPAQLVLQPRLRKSTESLPHTALAGCRQNTPGQAGEPLDHRSRSPFIVVQRGEELAFLCETVSGRDGHTVTGARIRRQTQAPEPLEPGRNTVREGDRVVAACSGRFVTGTDAFWVEDTLEITGDVDYTTGHINFPGNVLITGIVKDRFRVWVGGDLECHGALDAFEVFCKGALTARGGIIGRGHGLVRVVGAVTAHFIENCAVESKSDVEVSGSVLKSRVYCLGALRTGERGRIVGSELRCGAGLQCSRLGNEAHTATTVACGVDFVAERQMERLKARREQLIATLDELERRLEIARTAKREREREHAVGLLKELEARLQALSVRLLRNPGAEVAVDSRVYPGVTITIGTAVFTVDEPLKRVRFRLDPETKRVVCENPP